MYLVCSSIISTSTLIVHEAKHPPPKMWEKISSMPPLPLLPFWRLCSSHLSNNLHFSGFDSTSYTKLFLRICQRHLNSYEDSIPWLTFCVPSSTCSHWCWAPCPGYHTASYRPRLPWWPAQQCSVRKAAEGTEWKWAHRGLGFRAGWGGPEFHL